MNIQLMKIMLDKIMGSKYEDAKETVSKKKLALAAVSSIPLTTIWGGLVGLFMGAVSGIIWGEKAFWIGFSSVFIPAEMLGLYITYRSVRGLVSDKYYNDVIVKSVIKNKRKDVKIPSKADDITSYIVHKGANYEYSKVIDFKNQTGELYIANFKVANEVKDFVSEKLIKEAEKTEIHIQASELTKTLLAVGRMGSGKSVFLKNIYAQRIYNRAVVNDIKGEYVEAFYNKENDIIYNPYDRRTKIWDMFADIRKNPALASVIAESIALSITKEKDFWVSSASKLLEDGLLSSAYTDASYQTTINYIEKYKDDAVNRSDKTALSVYATLQPVLDVFLLLSYLEKKVEKFSLYDFASSTDKKTIFLLLDPAHSKAVMPLTNALLTALISILLSKPDTRDDYTLFLLDEFLNIHIPESVLTPLFTVSRSKGIQLILASQYLPADNQSQKLTQLVLNSRHILALFQITEPNTLKTIKENFGEIELTYTEKIVNVSSNYSTSREKMRGLFHIPNESITSGQNSSSQEQIKREKRFILDEMKILNMPEHNFIYIQSTPFRIALAKVEKFYYNNEKKNNYFEEMDLADFYRSRFLVSSGTSDNASDNTSNNVKKYLDI